MKFFEVPDFILPFGYGIALPFGIALVRKSSTDVAYQKAHEAEHIKQARKECCYLLWLIKYLGQVIKHGYTDAPYEVQAREQGKANAEKYR